MAKKPWNHGKIVACTIFSQLALDLSEIEFKNELIDFNMCTHLNFYDQEMTHMEGKKEFKNQSCIKLYTFLI